MQPKLNKENKEICKKQNPRQKIATTKKCDRKEVKKGPRKTQEQENIDSEAI